jgi:macrolide transport system ATP-binding/permease protein
MNKEPLIKLSNICRYFSFGENVVRALEDINLQIWPGEFVAIMGPSGSGKSTLMQIIGCLDQPSYGSYKIFGDEVSALNRDQLAELRRNMFGFVFQRYNLLPTATAEENVAMPAVYAGMRRHERLLRARALLAKLGLSDRADRRPAELSGGQQQRTAIGRALMNEPTVILADEPTGSLDSTSGEQVMELLRSLHREGRTLLLITHDERVAGWAERVVRIHDGRIAEETLPKEQNRPSVQTQTNGRDTNALVSQAFAAARTAITALSVNLFRTVLTLLGIVIGVAAVVTMLAVGNGSKQKVLEQITSMGTNLLTVRPGAPGIRSTGDVAVLTLLDAEALAEMPNIEIVVPERSGRMTVRFEGADYSTSVSGVGVGLPFARDWVPARGSFFNSRDLDSYGAVAVLGQTVADALFPYNQNPIGNYILMRNIPFEVIGVMSPKGASSWGNDQDDTIFVPVTTALVRLFGKSHLSTITLRVSEVKWISVTEAAVANLLRIRHGREDFRVRNSAATLEAANDSQNTLTILLGTVAAISLLVGGIGIMNIMLVSVTERTREIGIRMATGARVRDVLLQFNTEAAIVGLLGGFVGVILGFIAAFIISLFGVAIVFSIIPALVAFICALVISLLFGYVPARKAAMLNPIAALGAE